MPKREYTLEDIREEAEKIHASETVSREQYLALAQRAVEAYRYDPEGREEIAYLMTGIWGRFDELRQDEDTHEIGGMFASLELPDEHVDLEDYESVEAKWGGLADKIDGLLKQ